MTWLILFETFVPIKYIKLVWQHNLSMRPLKNIDNLFRCTQKSFSESKNNVIQFFVLWRKKNDRVAKMCHERPFVCHSWKNNRFFSTVKKGLVKMIIIFFVTEKLFLVAVLLLTFELYLKSNTIWSWQWFPIYLSLNTESWVEAAKTFNFWKGIPEIWNFGILFNV